MPLPMDAVLTQRKATIGSAPGSQKWAAHYHCHPTQPLARKADG